MPDQTPEQAVAFVLDDAIRNWCATSGSVARALLAAVRTDPAVQDAVLAALAEGGRLVEERRTHPVFSEDHDCTKTHGGLVKGDARHLHVTGWSEDARYVEPEWREAPNA